MKQLNESSLSRIWRWIKSKDIAIISAFRGKNINCRRPQNDSDEGYEYTKKDNLNRNKILKAKLLKLGYGVTATDGSYIEQYGDDSFKEFSENSFFVVNLNNDSLFFKNIIRLGTEFCQDSVLVSKKGSNEFYFVGTNNSDFPGYLKKFKIGNKIVFGKLFTYMSKVRNRPFAIINTKDLSANPKIESYFESFDKLSLNSKRIVDELSHKNVCCK